MHGEQWHQRQKTSTMSIWVPLIARSRSDGSNPNWWLYLHILQVEVRLNCLEWWSRKRESSPFFNLNFEFALLEGWEGRVIVKYSCQWCALKSIFSWWRDLAAPSLASTLDETMYQVSPWAGTRSVSVFQREDAELLTGPCLTHRVFDPIFQYLFYHFFSQNDSVTLSLSISHSKFTTLKTQNYVHHSFHRHVRFL